MAETYHIYDIHALPASLAATLTGGLREDSRVKMAIRGDMGMQTMLLATIADRAGLLLWQNSKDGQKNRNRPDSIYESILNAAVEDEDKPLAFETGEELDREYERLANS